MLFHPIIRVESSVVTRKFCISITLVSNDDYQPFYKNMSKIGQNRAKGELCVPTLR